MREWRRPSGDREDVYAMSRKPPTGDFDDAGLEVSEPKTWAAGMPGVTAALRHSYEQMGVRRTALTLLRVNQKDGFDCPGCAWPERRPEARRRVLRERREGRRRGGHHTARHPRVLRAAHRGRTGRTQSDYWLGQQGRLTEPMLKRAGSEHYEPMSWDEAFGLMAAELNALDSPDEAVFYTSGRTSNEAAFPYQLFVRAFGTNNLPDCSQHVPRVVRVAR